ncbi:MAG TPA: membrane protein insertase YidC [Nevskiaceae bacterium]|nr:membrane protein insertase YidC [Nevskiaceae bacterium]
MENRRFILLALLAVVGFFLYQAWQHDYPPTPQPQQTSSAAPVPAAASPTVAVENAAPAPAPSGSTQDTTQRIRATTDQYIAEFSSAGGDLRKLWLVGIPVSKQKPDEPLALLDEREGHVLILESGIAGKTTPLATQATSYTSPQPSYTMRDGQDALGVEFEHEDATNLVLRKRYEFHRGSYEIALTHTVVNHTDQPIPATTYLRLISSAQGTVPDPPFLKSFRGIGVYQQKEASDRYTFQETAFTDLDKKPIELPQKGGWISVLQHYFLAAILPTSGEPLTFTGKAMATGNYMAQYVGTLTDVPPQSEKSFTTKVYLGPNLQGVVDKAAPGLELTRDYGSLKVICEPLFVALAWLHKATRNWGFAIILLTLIVRGAMYKLSEAQYRSMAKMKKFAPRIQEIKERYGEDRERLNKAMMDLYKKEGFNPLAGCWPLLVQFPVFIALYRVLSQSVELRQADFALWIHDLSAPDPIYVLPLLFGATMWAQQKLSGQTMPDPTQQRIMNLMPIMMTAFFAFFPAGLVLYWFVSNLTGIAQQWYITRKLKRLGLA